MNIHKSLKQEIDYIIAEVKATHAVDKMYMTEEEESLCRAYLKGLMTEQEAIDYIIKSVKEE